MPVVPCDYNDLVARIGNPIPRDELVARVPMMGGAYDGEKDGKLLFEFFPNRPDLLTIEGLARACRDFFDHHQGLTTYNVEPSGDHVTLDKGLAKVRPHAAFAYVRGLTIDDALLAQLIDVQERLTTGPGRRRAKVAIGLHDAGHVRGPYTFDAVPRKDVRFVPLQSSTEMTAEEILTQHEKGRLFGSLLEGHARVPLIRDQAGNVLSMPPIINGQLTALTTRTRDVLIDVTGTEARATHGLLAILATSLAERGGRIQSLEVRRGATTLVTPDLTPQETPLRTSRVKELLGLAPSTPDLQKWLGRMGHDYVEGGRGRGTVRSPAWRLDLLHPDDLVEDVGIGHGFDKFTPRLPETARFGGVHARTHAATRARTSLLGLGFLEALTLTITSRQDALGSIGAASRGVVEVENPVTGDHAILRPHLYTGLLGLLRSNRNRELPQALFEVGTAVPLGADGLARNELRACAVRTAARATFAEAKGVVEALLRDLGQPAEFRAAAVGGLIPGRAAVIVSGTNDLGFFGEVHPDTLAAFDLVAPAYVLEVHL